MHDENISEDRVNFHAISAVLRKFMRIVEQYVDTDKDDICDVRSQFCDLCADDD